MQNPKLIGPMHIQQYAAKGFAIKRVTSDGEASVRAVKSDVEALGVEVNILDHGSHTPHTKAAIGHIKNKARSTMYSLPYSLPSKLAAALIAFVVHAANMVPKINAVGHLPAHTAFSSYCFHGQLILLSAHTAFIKLPKRRTACFWNVSKPAQ